MSTAKERAKRPQRQKSSLTKNSTEAEIAIPTEKQSDTYTENSTEAEIAIPTEKQSDTYTEDKLAWRVAELDRQRERLFQQVQDELAAVKNISTNSTGEDPAILAQEQTNLITALEDFQKFFVDYTDYFFSRESALRERNITYERILAKSLVNAHTVWSTLSLALNQRYNPAYTEKLKRARQFSAKLQQQSQQIVDKSPIIYFDKIFHIVRYPYQAYPLLGIPLDRFQWQAQDKGFSDGESALAHELGHHVFWNNGDMELYTERMRTLRIKLAESLLRAPLPAVEYAQPNIFEAEIARRFDIYYTWSRWLEETFADVFGALLVGPSFIKSSQNMLTRDSIGTIADLVQNDGEHPMPVLRPYISLAVFEFLAERGKASQPDMPFWRNVQVLTQTLGARWNFYWEKTPTLLSAEHWAMHGHLQESRTATPHDLRSSLTAIVEMLLTTPLFAPTPAFMSTDSAKRELSLLESVQWWGQNPSEAQADLTQLLNQTDLLPQWLPSHSAQPALDETRRSRSLDADQPFDRFLHFISEQRQHRLEELQKTNPAAQPESELWEDLLDFELVLNHGHFGVMHDSFQTHTIPSHRHTAGGVVWG